MILVTGASGFLGGEIVKQLVVLGERVRIIVRPNSDISNLQEIQTKIEIVYADVLDIPSLEIAFEDVKKIYHSAAIISYDSSNYDAMYKCNIEGTANVVNVALSKNVEKLIHISSIAAIGGNPNELIDEETPWEKNEWTTHYGITKMLAEREVWRGMQEGLDTVIVNPGIILGYGKANKATMRIFKNIQQGKMPFYTLGTNGFVDVQDVVQCCIQLMNADIKSERFILVGENLSFKTYFELIAETLKVKAPTRKLNKTTGYFFLFLDWLISAFSNRKRGLTKENLNVSLEPFEYSNEKIKQAIPFSFTPIQQTIERIAENIKDENINKH
ncbi:MAG: NAD-dependent epimerase/dehydratase family protein [Chitinophagales bacterium]